MAAPSPSLAWHEAPLRSSRLCFSNSAMEWKLSSLRWHHVHQPPLVIRFAVQHSRYACLRRSLFEVRAEKDSQWNSWIPEANERGLENKSSQISHSNLLLKLLIVAVVVAAVFTLFAAFQPQSGFTMMGTKVARIDPHYKIRLLGRELLIGERSPGWIYFWLLMAAGFGLFVSEEALNVWVGAVLARTLIFDSSWRAFSTSVFENGLYIFSTVFWVYWGVCISDMIPFYAGRFAAQTKAGDTLRKKVGVSEEKLKSISQSVQRYGNLIGFVERFSVGVRNPTAFMAGAMGVSPDKFFAGVCLGALITLPLQMGVGCILREHPVRALAGVATAVAAWTVFPYIAAAIASIAFVVWNKMPLQNRGRSSPSRNMEE
ncbi:hypothetical protein GOP47_0006470 [Adiantum capillus-veneris]|uniref:VTT domain-containing protein n=1 Tax=Adiantum capillus-veneris TaxID=13818 RepID=A0A9D4V3C2_ADICA|nr:hypothetical protein GOP47_0006470 [Adiantum capillus-veneris]